MLRLFYRYSNWILCVYMVGAIVLLLLIESVFNGGFAWTVKWLWLPLALLVFGFTWFNRHFFYAETRSRRQPWLVSIILYPIALLMTWPYVLALNAATAPREMMTYSGPIVRKWIQHSARFGDTFMIELRDIQSSNVITLTIPPPKYDSLAMGDVVTEQFSRGGFGIPFRWRFHKAYLRQP